MRKFQKVLTISAVAAMAQSPLAQAELLDGQARCGTVDIIEHAKVERAQGLGLPQLDRDVAGEECWENNRPTYIGEEVYTDDTYKFVIHYTTDESDPTAVTLAEVEDTAQIMRDVMDLELDTLGYLRPPDDSVDAEYYCAGANGGHGGNGYYDVYFVDEDGVYGYAQPTVVTNGFEATSYLALSTWILDYPGALEVTVAHEYFHAVQFAYDVYESSAWMESSATWMEEVAYDEINDYYNYLEDAFKHPDYSLDTFESSSVIQYGNAIFPIFLSTQLDVGVVKDIWDACAAVSEENYLPAAKEVLDDLYDGGFHDAMMDFRYAMLEPSEFEEGSEYPAVTYWEEAGVADKDFIEDTGAHFIKLDIDTQPRTLCFEADSDDIEAWLLTKNADDKFGLMGNFRGTSQLDIYGDNGVDLAGAEATLMVVSSATTTVFQTYSYDASGECEPPRCGCGPCSTTDDSPFTHWSGLLLLGLLFRPRRSNDR